MRQFSGEHVAALIATVLAAGAAVAGARRHGATWTEPLRRSLAAVILGAYAVEQLTYAARGTWTVRVNLPFQLTDAVTFVSVAALLRPGAALLVELLYFWAFTATLQAVLTPDLGQAFPDVLFFTFFLAHSGAIVAACLHVLGARRVPRRGAAWRAYGITVGFAVLAAIATALTGGNYMFLREKPAEGSLLDVMGPWPWYIAGAAALAALMFLVLELLAGVLRRQPAAAARASASQT